MAIQGSQAVPVATPIVFWRPTRFSRSQETAESHRLLTIIFFPFFVNDIVKVIANDVRVESHRPSLLMSSVMSTQPLVAVIDDIFVDVFVFCFCYCIYYILYIL